MAHFEFIIPLKRDDLLDSEHGHYKVGEAIPMDEIVETFDQRILNYENEGCEYILDDFDHLYYLIGNFYQAEWSFVMKVYNRVIYPSIKMLPRYVDVILENEELNLELQLKTRNVVLMNLYVFTQFISATVDRIIQETNATTAGEKGRNKKKKALSELEDFVRQWEDKERQGFIAFYHLIQLNLCRLWEEMFADESFVNMCANCCYKALENPTIGQVKYKALRDTIFQVLGMLIKKYQHGISCAVKIVQLLSLYDHIAPPLAQAVVMFVRDLGCRSLMAEIVHEIGVTENSQDSGRSRAVSTFISEIALSDPQIVQPVTNDLISYLSDDPYSMRICVLTVMTEILLAYASKGEGNLDEAAKEQRTLFMDLMEEHLLDCNAFVRAKLLNLWQKLVETKSLPKQRVLSLFGSTVQRVRDKSSVVSKNAIQLLRTIFEHHRFLVEFSTDAVEEVEKELGNECAQLQDIEKKVGVSLIMPKEDIWNIALPAITECMKEFFENEPELTQEYLDSQDVLTQNSFMDGVKRIRALIHAQQYMDACKLLFAMEKRFPLAKQLRVKTDLNRAEFMTNLLKAVFVSSTGEDEKEVALEAQRVNMQKRLVDFLSSAKQCGSYAKCAVSAVSELLEEKSGTDVLEAIQFMTLSHEYNLPGAEAGVQQMLKLVSSKEPGIRDAVIDAYTRLYFNSTSDKKEEAAVEIIRQLSNFVKDLKMYQFEGMSDIISEWMKNGYIDEECIKVVWKLIKSSNTEARQTALILLNMIANEEATIVKDKLSILIKYCIAKDETRGERDLMTVLLTCRTLTTLVECTDIDGVSLKFKEDDPLFIELISAVKENFLESTDTLYPLMAQMVVDIVFMLCRSPVNVIEGLLVDLYLMLTNLSSVGEAVKGDDSDVNSEEEDECNKTLCNGNAVATNGVIKKEPTANDGNNDNDVMSTDEDHVEEDDEFEEERDVNTVVLGHFVMLVGHVGLRMFRYYENDFLEELKEHNRAMLAPEDRKPKRQSQSSKDNSQEGETIVDAVTSADDAAVESVRCIMEDLVLGEKVTTMGQFSLIVRDICVKPKKYQDDDLLNTASVALSQLMMISSKFCSENMQLLVTLMEKSEDEETRLSLAVAMGDLLLRFPNVVQPWSQHLYARLRDESSKVRLITLFTLYHLITNEMVKVKGQISEVALCIADAEEDISSLACKLFVELGQKGNTLYNVLTDIISHLSNPCAEVPVSEETFQMIMKFLIEQIQKERQFESLVEKLCKRMQTSTSERQWKDLVYCLSLLSWSDRCLRKLLDHASCYVDKLVFQPVTKVFVNIACNAMKSAKPEVKEAGTELHALIEEVLSKGIKPGEDITGIMNNRLSKKATPMKSARKTTPAKTQPSTVKRPRVTAKKMKKIVESDEDEDSSSSTSSVEEKIMKPSRPAERTSARRGGRRLFTQQ